MRYAINIPNFGAIGDARALAELAHEAEESGWDGFFLWDHIGADWGKSRFADPLVTLTAIAMSTSRMTLGPLVTPLPRRRPWVVAREAVTLDRLSHGRLILGVGIGSDFGQEFSAYGESPDDKVHGAMLDEELEIISCLWTEKPLDFDGAYYHIHGVRYHPGPVQQPRIPIWVAAVYPNKKPCHRAARWDGIYPIANERSLTPDNLREMLNNALSMRSDRNARFDVLTVGHLEGKDPAADAAIIAEWEDAGATWWQEGFLPSDTLETVRARIQAGPPRA